MKGVVESTRRKNANLQLRRYWLQCNEKVERGALHKDKVPTFTRHNGNRIKRLGEAWRAPKGSHGNKLTCPRVGYKRPEHLRYRRSSDGLLLRVVHNLSQMNVKLKSYEVLVLASALGARKRTVLLAYAKEKELPVYVDAKR